MKDSVYVSYISSRDSCIYVQVESVMFQYLTSTIQLLTPEELSQYTVTSAASLLDYKDEIFLAKFDQDGVYYRAKILDFNPLSNIVS